MTRLVLWKSKDTIAEEARDRASATNTQMPANEEIGKCGKCGGPIMRTVDGTTDAFCRSCGQAVRKSRAAVSNPAGDYLVTLSTCRAEGESRIGTFDRVIRENAELYAAHVTAVRDGGASLTKAQSAAVVIEEAVDSIVSKSEGVSRAAARAAFMQTETGQALYRLHMRQSAVVVS